MIVQCYGFNYTQVNSKVINKNLLNGFCATYNNKYFLKAIQIKLKVTI